jgi:hypothetical protein
MSELQDLPAMHAFAVQAEEFCALVDSHVLVPQAVFLQRIHRRLAPLYAAALELPAIEASSQDAEDEEETDGGVLAADAPALDEGEVPTSLVAFRGRLASLRTMLGSADYYAEVFDAYELPLPSEPVIGSLADDLTDIYDELSDGLRSWTAGDARAALWRWRFGFTVHWGEHLTSALRALHVRAATHDGGFPAQSDV